MKTLLNKIFGSWYDRYLKRLNPIISQINGLEAKYTSMTDAQLAGVTADLKAKLAEGQDLDDILPDAFAAVRETSRRVMGMRHYDVQLIGGYVLHKGQIPEMKTGEGKTLVATLALYLNALSGKGAHLVTVNDYLAKRDATWMSPIYMRLGLSVGIIQNNASRKVIWDDEAAGTVAVIDCSRQESYACDITYGTNNEFGFDYLRDNMKFAMVDYVQRELNFAIVDEVDSILIDEARTPLIISGPTEASTDKYYTINNVVKNVKPAHYTVDEKARTATLTDEGINYVEQQLNVGNIFDVSNVDTLHFVNNALKAHVIFKLDVDYVVQEGQVIIVDEFTGRYMHGRRFSDGLHQALEAKENVQIQRENQTLASITFQNYFRMYKKLAGMTGTALTEAEEFREIYNLPVIPIPTNKPMQRKDYADSIYKDTTDKYNAIVAEVKRLYEKGQPVLVGTVSIEKSEFLSALFKKHRIQHDVLNAKNHEREAAIIENAGQKKAVTIATNMAGRGTDIKLGEGVAELGGLFILGTERHESRRIDNQLRGRSGRQGDAGESHFYLSMEDDLLRIFGAGKIKTFMEKLKMEDGEPIEHTLISRAIEGAQKKVEAMHFEVRKHLLKYDNVANQQRNVIYGLRRAILSGEDIAEILREFSDGASEELYNNYIAETRDNEAFKEAAKKLYDGDVDLSNTKTDDQNTYQDALTELFNKRIEIRKAELAEHFLPIANYVMINTIDSRWKEHLLQMDYLRDSVGLRGYGQKDPLIEYQKESFAMFAAMYNRVQLESLDVMMHVQLRIQGEPMPLKREKQEIHEEQRDIFAPQAKAAKKTAPAKRTMPKVGRNDPCPCGSGKKYKQCHGAQS
ncbi:MAG: preprotein translocase subunit SecA [Deferribacteraceae bacterium]|jgi:preprotein translocase subunit SecA|nr:preprotein translocase subunit SecA [Deferribacteraceae bacterium]